MSHHRGDGSSGTGYLDDHITWRPWQACRAVDLAVGLAGFGELVEVLACHMQKVADLEKSIRIDPRPVRKTGDRLLDLVTKISDPPPDPKKS